MVSIVLVLAVLWQFSSIRECSSLWQLPTPNITRPLQDTLNKTVHVAKGVATPPFNERQLPTTNITQPLKDTLNKTVHVAKEVVTPLFNGIALANFTYTVPVGINYSNFLDDDEDIGNSSRVEQVDCLGLGKTVATALEWFFRSKPNGTSALDVQFFLSSRRQPHRVRVILGEQFGLEWADFKIERRTVIIVHGFLSHGNETWISDMEKALFQWGDVNVIVVDWSAGGDTWNYYKAAVNTKIVGYQISKLIEHVINTTIINEGPDTSNWGPLHLIGHSLGAHICGMAAKELKKRQSRWTVQRITGLDPAQPCFRNADPSVHLHKNDAPFVDVIHTNGKLLLKLGLGLPEILGDVDFYPNGGKTQPGCAKTETSYFDYLPIPITAIQRAICSHGRSYVYLTESLVSAAAHNCSFWAHNWNRTYRQLFHIIAEPCNPHVCTEMGIKSEMYHHRGSFFVATASAPPFCANSTNIIEEVERQLRRDHASEIKRLTLHQ